LAIPVLYDRWRVDPISVDQGCSPSTQHLISQ
jgi:hypothetical protein